MFRVLSIPRLVINRRQLAIKKKSLGVSSVWPIRSREGLAIVVEKLLLLIEQRSLSSDKNFEDSVAAVIVHSRMLVEHLRKY